MKFKGFCVCVNIDLELDLHKSDYSLYNYLKGRGTTASGVHTGRDVLLRPTGVVQIVRSKVWLIF